MNARCHGPIVDSRRRLGYDTAIRLTDRLAGRHDSDLAVTKAARIFDAEPYMTETAFRRELERGRILPTDVDAVLDGEPNKAILTRSGLDRRALRRAMLIPGVRDIRPENVQWLLDEGDLLRRLRPDIADKSRHCLLEDGLAFMAHVKESQVTEEAEHAALHALFSVCNSRVGQPSSPKPRAPRRPHEGFEAICGESLDDIIHPYADPPSLGLSRPGPGVLAHAGTRSRLSCGPCVSSCRSALT